MAAAPRFDPAPAAQALAEAWRDGQPISALPEGAAPRTVAQARRIAHAVLEELDLPVVGIRVLAGGGAAALAGPLLAPRLAASGAVLPAAMLPGGQATAAVLFPLARALPSSATPYTARRVLAALAPPRAAIDLSAWRAAPPPESLPARLADLSGLGHVVLAGPARGTPPDPASLRLAWGVGKLAPHDVRDALLAAAEAARAIGGLPAGAALLVAGLSAPEPLAPAASFACRVVGGGLAEASLA